MRLISALTAALLPLYAAAFNPSGLRFEHLDWELACDNTGTCRAAGYFPEVEGKLPVTVLMSRVAGPQTPVTVQVMLGGEYAERPAYATLAETFDIDLNVDGKAYGKVAIVKDSLMGELSEAQVGILLASLPRQASIEFGRKQHTWQLSDRGAAAVLLKMDEYQGRLGTPGALVKKGTRPESSVPPASPVPVIVRAAYAKPVLGDQRFVQANRKSLVNALLATVKDQSCDDLKPGSETPSDMTAQRLNATQMLVSAQCSIGHDPNYGYWIVNQKPPFQPLLLSTEISEDSPSESALRKNHKGVGDHWTSSTLTWDGKRFQVSEESVTGTERPIKAGGGWTLPTVVTQVR